MARRKTTTLVTAVEPLQPVRLAVAMDFTLLLFALALMMAARLGFGRVG